MDPGQVGAGLTLVIAGVSAIVLLDWLGDLAGYWTLTLGEHGWALVAPALTTLASVIATILWAARTGGLGELGRKVQHIDRGLREDVDAHERDLAAVLRRDCAA